MSFRTKRENYAHSYQPCQAVLHVYSFLLPEINSGQAVPRNDKKKGVMVSLACPEFIEGSHGAVGIANYALSVMLSV